MRVGGVERSSEEKSFLLSLSPLPPSFFFFFFSFLPLFLSLSLSLSISLSLSFPFLLATTKSHPQKTAAARSKTFVLSGERQGKLESNGAERKRRETARDRTDGQTERDDSFDSGEKKKEKKKKEYLVICSSSALISLRLCSFLPLSLSLSLSLSASHPPAHSSTQKSQNSA